MHPKKLTAITVCKGRLYHLMETLPLLVAMQNDLEVIVVDYGCPDGTGEWVRNYYPQVSVIKINDDAGFNLSRARNAGAKEANTPWLLFIDADVKVASHLSEWSDKNLQVKGYYVTSSRGTELNGTFFVPKNAFEDVDGYDECYRGWGGVDMNNAYMHLIYSNRFRIAIRSVLNTPLSKVMTPPGNIWKG
ncbi:hypothetical protein PHIN6_07850 [Polynucleobacter sp. HIN6]|uniref:glycosyltransferase family 2 protein n=1 Tax=Polynucleobacter sp. HIN6 TaxID=3047865 RepID=UPI002572B0F9|nr:glycosyltransferase family A protein [Polynucleobacter sp. HIN6]BEI35267.1 hypothetical protein PHIN6_07850 [Polynucleobacter sp. HIN6]